MADEKGIQRSSAMTLVLVVLKDGPRHGYDIAREVERRTQKQIAFNHGTLYPVLYSLEAKKMIESVWVQPDGERRRREYKLTDTGKEEAEKAIREWYTYAEAINRVIEKGTAH